MKPLRLRRRVKQIGLPLGALALLWLLLVYIPAQVAWGAWLRWAFAALLVWGTLMEPRRLQLTRLDLAIPGLPAALDGLRIVHLSDLHVGAVGLTRLDFMRAVLVTERCGPQLIGITGDLVARNPLSRLALTDAFALGMSAPLGVFAVLGNSDQKQPRKRALREELVRAGVSLLTNVHRVIEKDGHRILVVGVDDPVTAFADYDAAFRNAPHEVDLLVLLTHSSESLPAKLHDYLCPRLVLSGHTHGGQLRLPFALRKADENAGYSMHDGVHVNVSRGIGYVFPMRLFCPPEVTLITLKRDA